MFPDTDFLVRLPSARWLQAGARLGRGGMRPKVFSDRLNFCPTVSIFGWQSQFLAGGPNFCLLVSIFVWSSQFLAGNFNFSLAVTSFVWQFCIILYQPKSQFVSLLWSGFVQKSQFLANDIKLCNLCDQSLSFKSWVSFFVWLSQLLLGSFNFCPTVSDSVLTGLIASFHCDEEILKWKLS